MPSRGPEANNDWDRIDEDPDAVSGDTRLRVVEGDHGTYVIRREEYALVEFETSVEADDGQGFERYDWHLDEKFVLRSEGEAKQAAAMLAKAGAFDPNVLFFRQREFPGDDASDDEEVSDGAE